MNALHKKSPLRNLAAVLLYWRRRHREKINDERFVLIISLFVGVFTALAGWTLKWIIHTIEHVLTYSFSSTGANWLYLIFPVAGIGLTMLFIRYIVRDDIGHGVTKILFAIARNKSKIKLHNTFTSVLASEYSILRISIICNHFQIIKNKSLIFEICYFFETFCFFKSHNKKF